MLTIILATVLGMPPQAPPVDSRFTFVKLEVCSCGPACVCEDIADCASGDCLNGNCHPSVKQEVSYTFTGAMASGPGVPVLADSPCLSGNCPVSNTKTKTKSKTVTTATVTSEPEFPGYTTTYRSETTYRERPVRRGLFGGLFGGKRRSCGAGGCR